MPWLRLILSVLLAAAAAGCSALGSSDGKLAREESLRRMDPVQIQADTIGFADRFITAMTAVYDGLEARAARPVAKDAAHELKTDLALGAVGNAVNPRPVAGLIDMVVLVTLLRRIGEDPWTQQMFGDDAPGLIASLKQQEADVRSMASRYLTDAQLAELSELAAAWHRAHPSARSVSHVHLADLPEANRTPAERGGASGSVFGLLFFDPTSHLDPAVREVALSRATTERMFFYLQRLPLLLRLQVEGFYRQTLEAPQVKRTLEDVSAVAGSTTRFAEVSSRFTDVIGRFPQQVSEERQQAIRQIAHEMTQQRDAAIAQATTQIAIQRDQAIQQLASSYRQEQQALVLKVEAATARSINRLVWRLAALGLVLMALALGSALAYGRLHRRRARRPGRAPEHPA